MREEIKDSFDETSPISGELAVLVEDNLKIDMSTGYNTVDTWFEDSDEIKKVEASLPTYMLKFKFVDPSTSLVWYPMLLVNSKKILYPYPDPDAPDSSFYWAITKVMPIESKEDVGTQFTFILPTKVGNKTESVIYKLEPAPLKMFKKQSFASALDFYHEQEQL